MIPPRLNVVTLGARNLPRLRAFYEALGWPRLRADSVRAVSDHVVHAAG
jgi:catechol 2,3-dioxygenase-like lactoylglutathione lyase family enzyme